jgi:hypothetical protein
VNRVHLKIITKIQNKWDQPVQPMKVGSISLLGGSIALNRLNWLR